MKIVHETTLDVVPCVRVAALVALPASSSSSSSSIGHAVAAAPIILVLVLVLRGRGQHAQIDIPTLPALGTEHVGQNVTRARIPPPCRSVVLLHSHLRQQTLLQYLHLVPNVLVQIQYDQYGLDEFEGRIDETEVRAGEEGERAGSAAVLEYFSNGASEVRREVSGDELLLVGVELFGGVEYGLALRALIAVFFLVVVLD
mmetsp:Transcript_47282/g.143181  ORF Transcript_47282/g.143181 Transcript_47282/m.143181 type:complete len:200 (+) Transcript_47282:426-1025(+)